MKLTICCLAIGRGEADVTERDGGVGMHHDAVALCTAVDQYARSSIHKAVVQHVYIQVKVVPARSKIRSQSESVIGRDSQRAWPGANQAAGERRKLC